MFQTIALSLIAMTLWWWRRQDGRLRSMRGGGSWRALLAGLVLGIIVFPLAAGKWGHIFPAPIPAYGYIWHVLVILPTVGIISLFELPRVVRRRRGGETLVNVGRRKFLTVAAMAAPPLVNGALTAAAFEQLGRFRVRELDVITKGWPSELDGMTIALVADVHAGPFTTPKMLEGIVERTNTIHNGGPADLVVLGGDLINTSLNDLPAGLEMAKALRGRLGMVAIMGNHDVMDDRDEFIRRVENAGIPLLIEDRMILEPKAGVRVQLLGVDWKMGDAALYQSVDAAAARREGDLFPICLAHHPHAWDQAVRRGLPLVLSGHTHGGQLMLTRNIGAGPLKFRYWNGVHRRDGSTLVITNGVGNWFPLRVNAPAEIMKVTLRSMS